MGVAACTKFVDMIYPFWTYRMTLAVHWCVKTRRAVHGLLKVSYISKVVKPN